MQKTPHKILDDLLGGDISLSNLLKWYDNHGELMSVILHLLRDDNIEIFKIHDKTKTKINIWEIENIARQASGNKISIESTKDILISITDKGASIIT